MRMNYVNIDLECVCILECVCMYAYMYVFTVYIYCMFLLYEFTVCMYVCMYVFEERPHTILSLNLSSSVDCVCTIMAVVPEYFITSEGSSSVCG